MTGYYMATLEAALQHIFDLAEDYKRQQTTTGTGTTSATTT